jgi:nucleoside phosphorylase
MPRRLRREEYTVAWICAHPVERAAAQGMLDEEHDNLERYLDDNDNKDNNLYALGSMGGHHVVIVCLSDNNYLYNLEAARNQIRATFKGIQFGLTVGIGGGVPSAEADIRLGDVVVSQPSRPFGGVVNYDMNRVTRGGLVWTNLLHSLPSMLPEAVTRMRANEFRGKSRLSEHLSKLNRIPEFQRSKTGPDILFEAAYDHMKGQTCDLCSTDRQVTREQRRSGEEVVVHYGTIASSYRVMKSAVERDRVSTDLGGVLCFEMERADSLKIFPCLVIRGICDYADSHMNKKWVAYAAATAAACAKELLLMIPPEDVATVPMVEEDVQIANSQCSSPFVFGDILALML